MFQSKKRTQVKDINQVKDIDKTLRTIPFDEVLFVTFFISNIPNLVEIFFNPEKMPNLFGRIKLGTLDLSTLSPEQLLNMRTIIIAFISIIALPIGLGLAFRNTNRIINRKKSKYLSIIYWLLFITFCLLSIFSFFIKSSGIK